jgi:NAD(P)-dependent dehydrogenase (short-subunit alcohol dehydrogenase family)
VELLKDKKALISGSRRGIGAGIARVFAENGADVGINDIERDENADRIIAEIEAMGRKASWHQADIGNTADRNRMFDEFLEAHGRIDILVNNAVASADPHFTDITEDFWDFLVGHALKGYLFCSQRAVKEMIKQGSGGRIISISSVHSYRAWPQDTVYGIIKAGLNRMVLSMAVDLAGTGITSNCVAPGYIDSRVLSPEAESTRGNLDSYFPYALNHIPNRRGGVPRDIANACLFLASELGDYVNGQTITVDGGFLAGGVPLESVPLEPGMPGAIDF